MSEEGPPPAKRAKLTREQLQNMSKEELVDKLCEQDALMETMQQSIDNPVAGDGEDGASATTPAKPGSTTDSSRRENVLVMRLTTKEQELQEYMNQVSELKQAQNPSTAQLRSMLLDPAINLMFQRMKREMDVSKEKQEQATNDLAAWKFTPDSQTGKRLMARCRMLLQENDDLGKVISSGRTAKLESEVALEKTLVMEMKKSQAEMDEFLQELDEDVEGMQSTIYLLQQQLKEVKEQQAATLAENQALRHAHSRNPAQDFSAASRPSNVQPVAASGRAYYRSNSPPQQRSAAEFTNGSHDETSRDFGIKQENVNQSERSEHTNLSPQTSQSSRPHSRADDNDLTFEDQRSRSKTDLHEDRPRSRTELQYDDRPRSRTEIEDRPRSRTEFEDRPRSRTEQTEDRPRSRTEQNEDRPRRSDDRPHSRTEQHADDHARTIDANSAGSPNLAEPYRHCPVKQESGSPTNKFSHNRQPTEGGMAEINDNASRSKYSDDVGVDSPTSGERTANRIMSELMNGGDSMRTDCNSQIPTQLNVKMETA